MLQLFTPEFTSSKGLRAAVSGRQGRRRDVETEEGGVDPGGKLDPIECEKGDRRKAFRVIEN